MGSKPASMSFVTRSSPTSASNTSISLIVGMLGGGEGDGETEVDVDFDPGGGEIFLPSLSSTFTAEKATSARAAAASSEERFTNRPLTRNLLSAKFLRQL